MIIRLTFALTLLTSNIAKVISQKIHSYILWHKTLKWD